jgi:protein phosphatase
MTEQDAIVVAGLTSIGCVRTLNEDRASINGNRLETDVPFYGQLTEESNVLMVADGMGGHARGDLASDLALSLLESQREYLAEPSLCVEALRTANRGVFEAGMSDDLLVGMGATIVGVVLSGARCSWFNLGDSRAYLYRLGELRQLSRDHVPSFATGAGRKQSHAISQSLGGTRYPTDIWPSLGTIDVGTGDCIVLCSDGLTDVLTDQEISAHLELQSDTSKVVEDLTQSCISRGAPDNITILVISLGQHKVRGQSQSGPLDRGPCLP